MRPDHGANVGIMYCKDELKTGVAGISIETFHFVKRNYNIYHGLRPKLLYFFRACTYNKNFLGS